MAGLLTYSPLGTFPICSVISGMSFFQQVEWSLQQRDCSGLSPDSLFIRVSEQTPEHHFGRKGNTNAVYTVGKESGVSLLAFEVYAFYIKFERF